MFVRTFICSSLILLGASVAGAQQHRSAGSARDAFWSASDLVAVTPNPAAHKATASRHERVKPASTSGGSEVAGSGAQPGPLSNVGAGPSGPSRNTAELVADNGYGAAPHLLRTAENRLGLRYSVLLRGVDGDYAEVRPGTVFHSGDHIRLSLMANEPGYLYVIEQGSSGSWSPIYPAASSHAGPMRVEQGKVQEVPGGTQSFQFDQHAGEEKLFVILSRIPIADIDRRIEGLQGQTPASQPPPPEAGQMLEASNHIPDVFVQQMASRDLTLVDEEKVDEAATAAHGAEKAVYVVSKMANAQDVSGEVVASILLHHE